jgi:hypothetical protein
MTENMANLTQKMSSALGSMDLVKVNEVMGSFEKMFDNLDVNADFMDRVMDNVTAGTYEERDVNSLISQVAEEHHLKLESEFQDIQVGNKLPANKVSEGKEQIGQNN